MAAVSFPAKAMDVAMNEDLALVKEARLVVALCFGKHG